MTILCFLLLAAASIALQFPSVQTKAAHEVTDYLSEKLKFPVHLDRVDINWFDVLVLEGVSIKDPQGGQMIYVGELEVDFRITSLHKAKFNIDKATLRNGSVNLIRYAPEWKINMNEFIDVIKTLSAGDTTKQKPSPFKIDKISIENMAFSYNDNREPLDRAGFDHNHFGFDSVYADVTDLLAVTDTFRINVKNLRTKESHIQLRVHKINTLYTITPKRMSFENLYASVGRTIVEDHLEFNYDSILSMTEFNTQVRVISHIKNSTANFQDIAWFAPALKPYFEMAKVSGDFDGTVTRFDVNNLNLKFGKGSNIKGKASFDGLPNLDETFIEFRFNNTNIYAADLKQYLDDNSYSVVNKFGKMTGNGEYIGFFNDFVAKGNFNTDLGKIISDINLKVNNKKSIYKGHLITQSFNLGKLVNHPDKIQLLDMDGNIQGEGFDLNDAELKLKAKIDRIGINNYNYRNIVTNAELSKSLFNGEIFVKDTNLHFTAQGKVDLRENVNEFKIKANFERVNLKPLHLSSVETLLRTNVDLNFKGIKPDDIVGDLRFTNTYLLYKDNKEIFIDFLHAESKKIGGQRNFNINSDLLSLNMIGNFEFTQLAQDAERLYNEYAMALKNDEKSLDAYYIQKRKGNKTHNKYNIDFDLSLKNINSLVSIYVPDLYLSRNGTIQGHFSEGYTSILTARGKIDTVIYKGDEVFDSQIELSASKLSDSSSILGIAYITSGSQKIKSLPETSNFSFEALWADNKINFTTGMAQKSSKNNGNIKGTLSFLPEKEELVLHNSKFNLLNKTWNISEDNKIIFAHNEITFNNFTVSNASQVISINGTISDNADREAILKVRDFQIESINPLLSETKLNGTLNGDIVFKDLYKDLNMGGKIKLDKFLINNFLIGDVEGTSDYDVKQKRLNVNVEVHRLEKVIINLTGYMKASETGKNEDLNFLATLNQADIEILSPMFTGMLSDLSGKATGELKITGTIENPFITGKGFVQDGRLKVDYLGTTYHFEDNIYLEQNLIGFKKLNLRDEQGNKAVIDGGLYHDSFKNFVVNIKGYMDHFQVLNTTEKDNDLFYGEAIITGDMEMLGSFDDLQINANATSNKGTKVYIPLNTSSSLEQQNYITFKKVEEDKNKKTKDNIDLSGIKLNFNFDITPDAYAEIIFDKRTGDIIRGNGYGNLKFNIDTRGDFSMFGNYTITKGWYNFTLLGLINKEFNIQPNSKISWISGDPYEGVLDMSAVYKENVSLKPLTPDTLEQKKLTGKYPVNVLLDLQGNLSNPQITLGIDILKYPANASAIVTEFMSKIKSNDQEMNKQVFSLLVLRKFSGDNTFSGVSGSGSGTTNVSELLSNQLSNWLSQVDENLQIDIDLNSLDKTALNTFQLRLSYTMLDGRLRISRDQGGFQNYQSTNQASNITNIAGEWTIEYLLSQDGKFRLKLYNKNNTNPLLASIVNTNSSSAGFSILHTESFSSLKELFHRKKEVVQDTTETDAIKELEDKQKKQKEEEQNKGPQSNNQNKLNAAPNTRRKETEQ
ncbi:MAG TPA: translocation/assembly module TamB domain-containing protein [Cytophagaceae bacterium]|nr:translocation/assembly module TamB domain-containing protein [Cytophagaceae bacterium]